MKKQVMEYKKKESPKKSFDSLVKQIPKHVFAVAVNKSGMSGADKRALSVMFAEMTD